MTPKETDSDLPMSVQESLTEAWVEDGLLQGWSTEGSMGHLEGGQHYLHYLYHSWDSGKIRGREHSPAHQQKTGLKIY